MAQHIGGFDKGVPTFQRGDRLSLVGCAGTYVFDSDGPTFCGCATIEEVLLDESKWANPPMMQYLCIGFGTPTFATASPRPPFRRTMLGPFFYVKEEASGQGFVVHPSWVFKL